jgi:hypothetical protein
LTIFVAAPQVSQAPGWPKLMTGHRPQNPLAHWIPASQGAPAGTLPGARQAGVSITRTTSAQVAASCAAAQAATCPAPKPLPGSATAHAQNLVYAATQLAWSAKLSSSAPTVHSGSQA